MVARQNRHRFLAVLIGTITALALVIPAVAAPAASGSQTFDRSKAAAGWLARQMVNDQRFESTFDGVAYPDQGLTIDAVFAFAAARTSDSYAANAMTWLSTPDILSGYIGDGTTEAYAGATAKLALAVEVRGGDPAAFGGVDLIDRLGSLLAASGRFSDRSAWGDYSNMFGQSLAVLALDRTAAGAPGTAVSFLAASHCADGGFPVQFETTPCVSDVDATAMAVQALLAAGESTAVTAGVSWLLSVQATSGGFANASGVANANSTGLAAQALRAAGYWARAIAAKIFLRTIQVDCSGAVADRGAVDYDGGTFDPATAPRATAQAILGLALAPFAGLSAAGAGASAPVLACA
ncbi:MAG: peptidase [Dactylosporangium sp.]|nr:peptidase [Dactylosporangium sp.]NNJ60694.1 peptidase [Dactylosporangium sp.]